MLLNAIKLRFSVEVRAAAFAIATAVREMRPSAAFVTLGPSGWDDGLVVVEWEDSSGVQHEESVAFLHDTDGEVSFPFPDARNIAVGEDGELLAVPTMSLRRGEALLYTLDIERTLSQFSAAPPIAELLRVYRSPTSDTVVTAVFGVPVEDTSLIEQFTVNAFTRPTWDQWVRHRDNCLGGRRTVCVCGCGWLSSTRQEVTSSAAASAAPGSNPDACNPSWTPPR